MKAYVLLFFSCVGSAFGPPAYMQLSHTGLASEFIVGYFLLIGGIGLSFVNVFIKHNDRVKHTGKSTMLFLVIGLLYPLYFLGYIYAMKKNSINEVTLIVRTSSLLVVVLSSWFLSDKIKSWSGVFLSLLFCVVGIVFIKTETITLKNLWSSGVGSTLLVCVFAAFLEVLRAYTSDLAGMASTRIVSTTMIIGGVFVFVCIFFAGNVVIPNQKQIFYLLALGLCMVAMPAQFNILAYKIIGSQSRVTFFQYLIPVFTAIIAHYWNHEEIKLVNYVLGFVCIMSGILIIHKSVTTKK
jgi:drug/metabolite transporter (DMT)-like permease